MLRQAQHEDCPRLAGFDRSARQSLILSLSKDLILSLSKDLILSLSKNLILSLSKDEVRTV